MENPGRLAKQPSGDFHKKKEDYNNESNEKISVS